jgi:N-acyl-L-homoserine lactone synthetase
MEFQCEWTRASGADEAIDIRRRVYTEEFGFDLGGGGPSDELDQRAYHLVAKTSNGDPVASLRLLDADDRPFEIERFLDLRLLLNSTRHPAEITRLCILAPFRRITQASFVHLALLESVLRLTQQLGVSHIIASARTELMPFYRYLLFTDYPSLTYSHPEIGDSLHTLMTLDLATFPDQCKRHRPTLYPAVAAALSRSLAP